jgi:hypothetical protein
VTTLYRPSQQDCSLSNFPLLRDGGYSQIGCPPGIQRSWLPGCIGPSLGHWPLPVLTGVLVSFSYVLDGRLLLVQSCPDVGLRHRTPILGPGTSPCRAGVALPIQSLNVAPQVRPVISPSSLLVCLSNFKVSSQRSLVDLGQHFPHLATRNNYLSRPCFPICRLLVALQNAVPYS